MRYYLRFLFVAAALFVLAACDRGLDVPGIPAGDDTENPSGNNTGNPSGDDTGNPSGDDTETPAGPDPLRAIIVQPWETRTDFDSYSGGFAWSAGDEIAIHLSDGSYYSTPVDPETGIFTCSTTASKRRDAYAIYPASVRDASNYGNPTLNVVLPDSYDFSRYFFSNFSPVPMIAVNQEDQSDLYFRHVGGLIRLTCDGVPAATQKMVVTLDRNIAGTFVVSDADTDHPTISDGGDARAVTFILAEQAMGLTRTGEFIEWYYGLEGTFSGVILSIPVPVGTYSGLQLVALNEAGEALFSKTRNLSVTIARGYGKKYLCTLTGDAPDWIILDGEVSLGTLDNGGELSE